jgi:hypothetical protein
MHPSTLRDQKGTIMRSTSFIVCCFAIMLAAVLAAPALARQVEPWPYDKLFIKADYVVIVKAQSTEDAGKAVTDKPPFEDCIGVITTFKIQHVIKGDIKGDKCSVFHYRQDETRGANGPQLVQFHSKEVRIEYGGWSTTLSSPEYMLFLKKRDDGRFECVSGQIDPILSVRQILNRPLPKE